MPKKQKTIAEYRSKAASELGRLLVEMSKKISDLALEIKLGKTKDVRALRLLKKERARTRTVMVEKEAKN